MRRRRNSLRLTGFDYSQEGVYFVTMLIHARRRVLGTIVDGRMKLSETGRVIDKIWAQLPIQFGNIRTGRIQIMPDHLHGIIEIRTVSHESRTGAGARKSIGMLNPLQKSDKESSLGLINQTQTECGAEGAGPGTGARKPDWILMKQPGIQLGKIIRAFKAKSTRIIRTTLDPSFRWHRSFFDRVIRDDIERYFIEEYIELNPLTWELHYGHNLLSQDDLRTRLQVEHGLTGLPLERVIERESDYRAWLESEGKSRKKETGSTE